MAIWTAEAAVALAGGSFPLLAALGLVVAPGLALVPLLPASSRQSVLVTCAAVPALGMAAAAVAVTSVAATGIPLTGVSVRLVLLGTIVAGLALSRNAEPRIGRIDRAGALAAAGLALALVAGVVLEARVIGGSPVPGNDWAKYLLYADEIRREGSLLIDNPFWLLGAPFREEPGAPSLYASFLLLAETNTAVLMHGIWVFAITGILSMYAFVRSLWGALAGTFAALFAAIVPLSQHILGWHGLANTAALALFPLLFLYAAELLRRGLTRVEAAGFGLLIVSVAAMHRLSSAIALATLALCLVVALVPSSSRRRVLVSVAWVAAAVVVLGGLVAYHLIDRNRTFGGTQGFEAYESQKVDLELVARDLTHPFTGAGIAAVLLGLWLVRRDLRLVPVLAVLSVIAVLAYSWVIELPFAYLRAVYYLPLALAPLVGYALSRIARPRVAAAAGLVLALAMFIPAWDQARDVKSFYTFATGTSLKGLDLLDRRLEGNSVVVTDRCWSFLGTWLLRTRTLAALTPADIQPKAEVPFAEQARKVLAGTPEGTRIADDLGVRYMIVNPQCPDEDGRPLDLPALSTPVFVSRWLVVLARNRGDLVGIASDDVLAGDPAYRDEVLEKQANAGIRLIRQNFDWERIEVARGKYDFTLYDAWLADLAARRMRALPLLFGRPHFRPPPGDRARGGAYPPREFAAFGRFATKVVNRYGPGGAFWREHDDLPYLPIRAWQVWNEPNLPQYWGGAPNAAEYARLLAVTSRAIKRADPGAEVVSAGVPNSRNGVPLTRYLEDLLTAGAARSFDTLAIHPYATDVEGVWRAVEGARRALRRHDSQAPIWITELGWATGGPQSPFTVGGQGQAVRLEQLFNEFPERQRRLGIRGLVYYSWRDGEPSPEGSDFWGFHTGLLALDDTKKRGYRAFKRGAEALIEG